MSKDWEVIRNKGASRHQYRGTSVGPGLEREIAAITSVAETVLHDYDVSRSVSVDEKLKWMESRRTTRPEDLLYALYGICGVTPGANYGEEYEGARQRLLAAIHHRDNLIAQLLGLEELEKILDSCFEAYDEVFLLIDALDECPESEDVRHSTLECLAGLLQRAPRLKILATSRELPDIRTSMTVLRSEEMRLVSRFIDADIRRYVGGCLSRDYRLSRLDGKTKTFIEETIAAKADGMFRWAHCQLQELKKLKVTRPSIIIKALYDLPMTLDETYERILLGIEQSCRMDALRLLRWLAYARAPPSLGELVEVLVIDLTKEGSVEAEDRPGLKDALEILSGLVILEEETEDDSDIYARRRALKWRQQTQKDYIELTSRFQRTADIKIRLAHFSIKEYLESTRILEGSAKDFYFNSAREHNILSQSCLVYLSYYSSSDEKLLTEQDLVTFPLLQYAAESWCYHSGFGKVDKPTQEIALLRTESTLHSWLRVHQPDQSWRGAFRGLCNIGSGLYYASLQGLHYVVDGLLEMGADVDAQGGFHGNALQAASVRGHDNVVQMLLAANAEVIAQGGEHGNALQAASFGGREKVVQLLLVAKADINAQGGRYGHALQAASLGGYDKVVQILISADADVNAEGGEHSNALQAASAGGHEKVVRLLLEVGADVNARGLGHRSALHAAASKGQATIVQLLLEHEATITTDYNNMTPLHYAVQQGHEGIVKIILSFGTSVDLATKRQIWLSVYNQNGRHWDSRRYSDRPPTERNLQQGLTPLHYAALVGSITMTRFLLDQGADPNALSEYNEPPLHLALKRDLCGPDWKSGNRDDWNDPAFRIEYSLDLIDPPYDDENDEYYMIQYDIDRVRCEIVDILCNHHATRVLIRDCNGVTPLHCVPYGSGRSEIVLATLLSAGLEVDLHDELGRTAMHLACSQHDLEAVEFLFGHGARLEAVDNDGMNALHYAAQSGDIATIRLTLQMALQNQQTGLSKTRDFRGRDTLHILFGSSWYVEIAVVRLLVENGVELNDLTNDKCSPLALYLSRFLDRSLHKAEVAEYLLERGADPLFRHSTDGQNLGHLAAHADELDFVLLTTLARYRVDLCEADNNGHTILHHRAIAGSLEENEALSFLCDTIKLLLAIIDRSGKTPMNLVLEGARKAEDPNMFRSDRWHCMLNLLLARSI
nr:isoform 2 of ankyrin repeat domain-containing protein 50 [Quercus suber]